jgi:hypothetical protein
MSAHFSLEILLLLTSAPLENESSLVVSLPKERTVQNQRFQATQVIRTGCDLRVARAGLVDQRNGS